VGNVGQQTISPTLVNQADASLDSIRVGPYTMICKMLVPALGHNSRKFAFAQAAVNLARTACALERYRLAQGNYPAALDALGPRFIAKVPHDPLGGQPLHYRPINDGHFILYSVGWNEKDNGGTVVLAKDGLLKGSVDLDKGDWVWRYSD
ncbi:MAG: hypothetical protein ACREIC_25370, partial [Limisphaerales bacterium]